MNLQTHRCSVCIGIGEVFDEDRKRWVVCPSCEGLGVEPDFDPDDTKEIVVTGDSTSQGDEWYEDEAYYDPYSAAPLTLADKARNLIERIKSLVRRALHLPDPLDQIPF